ncbi:MAG: GNAT family N-acetyltransferase [Aestuariivirga sp.]|nr:GNAT family N-acetyltransferase [Aestuariivirga sp.]
MSPAPVEIIPFESRYSGDFKQLNLEWLEKYFEVEAADKEVLSQPHLIIEQGGALLLAKCGEQIIGTCAVIHEGDGHFEISKTSVTAAFQGQGIGRKLLLAALGAFKSLGGKELHLETNSALTSAIALYESSGFVHAKRPMPSPYARANVYMVYRPSA